MAALALPVQAAAPSDVTAIVRVDCRIAATDAEPHRLVGYVFTPTGVVRVTHDYGYQTSSPLETARELAALGPGVFDRLVARIATPRFSAPHSYRDVSNDSRMSDRRLAVRRAGTTAQFAIEEPAGAADRQFSYDAEIAVANAVFGLSNATWAPITGGFDPFVLCRTPRTALGRIAGAVAKPVGAPVSRIVMADCQHGMEPPGGPGLSGVILTPDGVAVRVTTPEIDRLPKDAAYERAEIGAKAYQNVSRLIETAPFFERSRSHYGTTVTDTRGTRVSASRGSTRKTWASEDYPTDRGAMIQSILSAVWSVTHDARLTWVKAGTATANPFSICRDDVDSPAPT